MCQCPGGVLEAKGIHLLRRGADKGNATGLTTFHKIRVFTEETIAGVDGIHAVLFHQRKQFFLVQVGLTGASLTQTVSLIGLAHMQGIPIRFGKDGNGFHAEGFEGAGDTGGDGAAVGNQNLVEHGIVSSTGDGSSRRFTPWPPRSSPGKLIGTQSFQIRTSMGVGL